MSNEGWVQAHSDLVDYLKENYTQKSEADYVFEVANAIKSDKTVYSAIDIPDWLVLIQQLEYWLALQAQQT